MTSEPIPIYPFNSDHSNGVFSIEALPSQGLLPATLAQRFFTSLTREARTEFDQASCIALFGSDPLDAQNLFLGIAAHPYMRISVPVWLQSSSAAGRPYWRRYELDEAVGSFISTSQVYNDIGFKEWLHGCPLSFGDHLENWERLGSPPAFLYLASWTANSSNDDRAAFHSIMDQDPLKVVRDRAERYLGSDGINDREKPSFTAGLVVLIGSEAQWDKALPLLDAIGRDFAKSDSLHDETQAEWQEILDSCQPFFSTSRQ